ncbi:MAG: DUF4395 domain-containing protein [Actinobacteria bacterium]|uniref:Unannotated protein n=2 Tax=freshwater metagenome TaxID=449393 RepID=A0A6J7QFS8_9ZZZZ|nr:DUF4395 family protein [Actinomycetota bacterium]MTH93518.1 DUF4395 family protein [Actinomycetota bacterium]NDG66562.1 DUF4395 domain-containing protein [Actinomycetota bacterium]
MKSFFSFPHPVNETSARIVAGGVVAMSVLFLVTQSGWVLVPLTYGFVARVLTGPTMSPLGRIATQVVTPRLKGNHKFVPGPPKRFAQGVGLLFSGAASLLWATGNLGAAQVVIAALVVAAGLESFFAICLGCIMFGVLMRMGVIPEDICEECSNIHLRSAAKPQ